MTRAELDAALARLGLDVPQAERDGILNAAPLYAEMARLVKKPRPVGAEPAHTVAFPKAKGE
ncbi:MAG: hypothetical protein JO258_16160 [Alphaproteobacteria bacterium]|nr:hypothetical protein [Alphaproteobacteria bacterium]